MKLDKNEKIIISVMNAVNKSISDLKEFKDAGFYYDDEMINYEMAIQWFINQLAKELEKKQVIDHGTAVFLCEYAVSILLD